MDNLSIECTELESPTTEANSPDPVLESYYLQQLQQQYADPSQALAPHGGAELDTTHEAASEKAQCERVEEYDFRLFTRPSALGPASVGTGNGPQRVTLSSPSPVGDALGLTSRGRPDEYYFSGATSPELAEQYTRAAVSGQEIMEGLKMRWVCRWLQDETYGPNIWHRGARSRLGESPYSRLQNPAKWWV